MADAIVAEALVKTYGSVRALAGVDLRVPEGTVLGILGPNGAGKTTVVRILTTLLRPDSGRAFVGGIDVLARPNQVRRIIGLSGQNAAVDEQLTATENMEMIGRLYHLGRREARVRGAELLERFDLVEAADRPAKTYSGGMRRRLDLACALVVSPPVIFLDEPTTGLDPRSRIAMWDIIGEQVRAGGTILLTTQYLEEADQLADDIVVIDRGTVIAQGTPAELKSQVGGERLVVRLRRREDVAAARAILDKIGTGGSEEHDEWHTVSVPVEPGASSLIELVRRLDAAGIDPVDIGVHVSSLEDVFMTLTGHDVGADYADYADDAEATR